MGASSTLAEGLEVSVPESAIDGVERSEPAQRRTQEPLARQQVILQLPWKHQFEFAGFYAAIDHGLYREQGLEVEIREYRDGLDLLDEVRSGNVTYGLANGSVIRWRLEGEPISLLANYFRRAPLVILARPGIFSLSELRGLTLMAATTDLDSPVLRAALHEEGLVLGRDLKRVAHTFDTAPFIRGEVDAMTAFLSNQPFVLEQRGVPFQILGLDGYLPGLGDSYLFTTSKEVARHPARTRAFVEASNAGWRYALEHPESVINLILSQYSQRKGREALKYEAERTRQLMLPRSLPVGSLQRERVHLAAGALLASSEASGDLRRLEGFLFDTEISDGAATTHPGANKDALALTTEEQAWLERHPQIVLGMTYQFSPDLIRGSDGELSGIVVDYLALLNRQLDGRIQLHAEPTWQAVTQKALMGEIDGFAASVRNPTWDKHFHYTTPYYHGYFYLYSRSGESVEGAWRTAIRGKRVGYLGAVRRIRHLLDEIPEVEPVPFADRQAMVNGLLDRQVDLLLAGSRLEWWRRNNLIASFQVSRLLEESRFGIVMSVRSEMAPWVPILNKALARISEDEHGQILERWRSDAIAKAGSKPHLNLNDEELAWLSAHPVIRFAIHPDWGPVELVSDEGLPQGISPELLARVDELLPSRFEMVLTRSFGDAIRRLNLGEIDLLPAIAQGGYGAQSLHFTPPYMAFPVAIFARSDDPYPGSLEALRGKRVAVLQDHALYAWLRQSYPNIESVSVATLQEGLEAVDERRVDAFVGNLVTASHTIGRRGLSHVRMAETTPYTYDLAMAVREDSPQLASILEKAIAAIPDADRESIYNRWVQAPQPATIDYALLTRVLLVVSLVVGVVLYWNWRLSREVERRQRAEIEARSAQAEADRANRAKSRFLASMSHELRTPLNSILGYAHLLQKAPLPAAQQRQANIIDRSGRHLLDLINEILDLARIEAGKLTLVPAPVELAPLLGDVMAMMQVRATEKGIELRVEQRRLPSAIEVDGKRLRQILLNLLGNAVKFTDEGQVTLRIRSDEPAEGGHESAQVTLTFEVIDSGPGIPADEIHGVFTAFEQAAGEHRGEGSGLGLPITRSLIEQMGGSIELLSRVRGGEWATTRSTRSRGVACDCYSQPHGTCVRFVLTLPRLQALPHYAADNLPVIGIKGPPPSVLVVDDKPHNRAFLTDLLRPLGISSDEASDGREALQQLAQGRYDLLLTDLRMPVMDGSELVRRVRDQPALQHLKCIVNSASVGAGERDRCLEFGADAFVSKPIHPPELFQLMSDLLGVSWVYGNPQRPETGIDETAAVSASSEQESEVNNSVGVVDLSGYRVLVADDASFNQLFMNDLLEQFGLDVEMVDNGRQAVEAVQQRGPFDLVFMDLEMPIMNGLEATTAIRALPKKIASDRHGRPLPIIALTAHVDAAYKEQCRQVGMDSYLVKPILPDAVAATVQEWLQGGSAEAASSQESPAEESDQPESVAIDIDLALRRVGGNEQLLARLLRSGFNELGRIRQRWPEMRAQNDVAGISNVAHSLISIAGMIGAKELLQACQESEEILRNASEPPKQVPPPLLDRLEKAISSTHAVLVELFGEE